MKSAALVILLSVLAGCASTSMRAVSSLDAIIEGDALRVLPSDSAALVKEKQKVRKAAEQAKAAVIKSDEKAAENKTMARVGWFALAAVAAAFVLAVVSFVRKI